MNHQRRHGIYHKIKKRGLNLSIESSIVLCGNIGIELEEGLLKREINSVLLYTITLILFEIRRNSGEAPLHKWLVLLSMKYVQAIRQFP
jgi:hypothetical protein